MTNPPAATNLSPADASGVPIARTRADLVRHEGTLIQVEGTFRFPTEPAFARNTLVLDDKTVVVLPRPSSGVGATELLEANNGARLAIRGLVYLDVIPAKYHIIGRTADPYLVELVKVERIE